MVQFKANSIRLGTIINFLMPTLFFALIIVQNVMLKTIKQTLSFIRSYTSEMRLQEIVKYLDSFAPPEQAEKWDNVGLLLEPYNQGPITKILLTIDLTERVMLEAVQKNANMIISYHPPIFAPLKRITQKTWKERIVSICLSKSIALYSPHTAWDSEYLGLNDWLARALPCENCMPIKPLVPNGKVGSGRIFTTDISLEGAIKAIQNHIGHDVHVAMAVDHNLNTNIKNVAVCAGSGSSLLQGVKADLYITGEMSHHELLDANHNNVSVILCNHSNSERGFLKEIKDKLETNVHIEVVIAETDEDPIKTFVKKN